MSKEHSDWFKKSDKSSTSKPAPKAASSKRGFFGFNPFSKLKAKLESRAKTVSEKLAVINPDSRLYKASLWIKSSYRKFMSRSLLLKILFTLLILLIFRVATSITMPAVELSQQYKDNIADSTSFLGIMDIMSGGSLKSFSIVALGISPYIMASSVIQMISTEAFPLLNRWTKSGPVGKRKINILTRVITLLIAVAQAITMIKQLSSGVLELHSGMDSNVYRYVALPMILVGGSMFTMFLGEQITNKGVGNGISLIIFSGIAVNLPTQFKNAYYELVLANQNHSSFVGVLNLVFYVIAFFVLIYIIGILYLAERRIPIQQTGAGLITDHNQMQHLPLKLNPAGVMPVMYAMTVTVLPLTIAQYFDHQDEGRIWIEQHMRLTSPIGLAIFVVLTVFFTMVVSFSAFNPYNVADGFKKSGTFIPGIRPGDETEKYLTGVLSRLAIFSSLYLSVIAAIQYIEQIIRLSQSISFGGTSLIILVSVSVETVSQIKARDKTQKIAKARKKSIASSEATGGLLW